MIDNHRPKCPNCGVPIDRAKTDGVRAFPCPHCGMQLELSKTAMRFCSLLLLVLSILCPWVYGLRGLAMLLACILIYGVGLAIIGVYFFLFPPPVYLSRSGIDAAPDSPITLDLTSRAKSSGAKSNDEVRRESIR